MAFSVIGPEGARQRDQPDLRRLTSAARSRPGSPRPSSSSGSASTGHTTQAKLIGALHLAPGQGINFDQVGRTLAIVALHLRRLGDLRCCPGQDRRQDGAAGDLHDARAGRGEAVQAAAELLRPAAARRDPEPGHQRHRQPRPVPAADDEPGRDLAADDHRRARRDDLDLAGCSRSSRSSPFRSRSCW